MTSDLGYTPVNKAGRKIHQILTILTRQKIGGFSSRLCSFSRGQYLTPNPNNAPSLNKHPQNYRPFVSSLIPPKWGPFRWPPGKNTPKKTNMTMENQPFEDVSPIKNGCFMCLAHIKTYSPNGLWMVIYHGRITNQTNPSHVRFFGGRFHPEPYIGSWNNPNFNWVGFHPLYTGWWFQPIWKILVKMGIFSK